jgi:hypothetical protein
MCFIKTWLTNRFPTHIPAIIVSILHTIKNNKEIEKQIKSMLSYEERKLLLLLLLEQCGDDSFTDDWPKIESLLKNTKESCLDPHNLPNYLEKYKLIIKYFQEKMEEHKKSQDKSKSNAAENKNK